MRLADAVVQVLRTEGVDRVFGNPGTSELPLVEAVGRSEVSYVLALQEAAAVAMADGYARMTRRPGFVNLHVGGGLANGLSNMINARRSRIPLVVTAGQQDTRHLDQEPMLSADNVGLARAASKTAVEVTRAADLPVVLRRAFHDSQAPPAGPVFVSIPMDILAEELDGPVPAPSVMNGLGASHGIAHAAALIAGDGVGREEAVAEAVRVAELLGALTYLQPLYDLVDFPADHALARGMLPSSNAAIHALLEEHDVVLLVGAHAFPAHYYNRRDAIPQGTTVVQVDSEAAAVGRNYPVAAGLVGGIRPTLAALADELERAADRPARRPAAAPPIDADPDPTDEFARALVAALPPDTIVVEEGMSFARPLRRALLPSIPGQFQHCSGGALGWGVGAALGVKLARPEQPVVAAIGDGSAMYAIQGLWSAARYGIGAVIVVIDNGEYRVLREGVSHLMPTRPSDRAVPGIDISSPAIEWADLAESLGVRGVCVDTGEALAETLGEALERGEPALIDVRVSSRARFDQEVTQTTAGVGHGG